MITKTIGIYEDFRYLQFEWIKDEVLDIHAFPNAQQGHHKGVVIQGQAQHIMGDSLEIYSRGDANPEIGAPQNGTLKCISENGLYSCLTANIGKSVIGNVTVMAKDDGLGADSTYIAIADGSVEIDQKTFVGPRILKLSSSKYIKALEDSVIVRFEVDNIQEGITKWD